MKATARSILAAAGLLLACVSASALAHGGGNGGGNGSGSGGGHGSMGGIGGEAGGMSASHMSDKGLSNTNSHISADRDAGLARASDRASLHAQHASLHAQSQPSKHSHQGKHNAIGHDHDVVIGRDL